MFFVFIVYVMLLLWQNIYSHQGNMIAGYTLNQMIWYLIITEMVTLSRSNVFTEVSEDVKKGQIAYLINKPYHYIFYCFSNSLGESGVKLTSNMIIGMIMGLVYVGPLMNLNLVHLPLILISLLLGMFLNFFIYINLALTAFWFEENTAFMWIYSKLVFTLGGMLIPIEMFPGWLEKVARYLPFAYVTYGPARLGVKFSLSEFFSIISFQVFYLTVFIFISIFVYRRGVKELNVNGG